MKTEQTYQSEEEALNEASLAYATSGVSSSQSSQVQGYSQDQENSQAHTLREALEERRAKQQDDGLIELSFYNLFWIFMVASFVGLLLETVVSYPIDGIWKDRAGFVWGPLSPIYGVGAVLMTLGLNGMKGKTALHTFAFAALLGGAFEFCAGLFFEEAFGIVAWSYESQPFNLMGHTCLGIALVWGALGLIWTRMLLPLTMDVISLIPQRIAHGLTAVATVFIVVDIVLTLGAFNCWFERSAGLAVSTPVQEFFDQNFGDEFMQERFQTMSLYPEVAGRDAEAEIASVNANSNQNAAQATSEV